MSKYTLAAEDAVRAVASRAPTWGMVSQSDKVLMRQEWRDRLGLTIDEIMLEALDGQPDEALRELLERSEQQSSWEDLRATWCMMGRRVTAITTDYCDRYLAAAYGPAETDAERTERETREAIARCEQAREVGRGLGGET